MGGLSLGPGRILTQNKVVAQQHHDRDDEQEQDQAIVAPHLLQRCAPLGLEAAHRRLPARLRRSSHDGMASKITAAA